MACITLPRHRRRLAYVASLIALASLGALLTSTLAGGVDVAATPTGDVLATSLQGHDAHRVGIPMGGTARNTNGTGCSGEGGFDVDGFVRLCVISAFPTAAMLAGSMAILCISFGSCFLHSMQHFAAGVLLSAISTELLPSMVKAAVDWQDRAAIALGFSVGVIVMLLVESMEEEADIVLEEEGQSLPMLTRNKSLSRLGRYEYPIGDSRHQRTLSSADKKNIISKIKSADDGEEQGRVGGSRDYGTLTESGEVDDAAALDIQESTRVSSLPYSKIVAVEIDAFLDGFLLGISASLGNPSTSNVMAMAISIEMGFVGVAYGGSFAQIETHRALPALIAAPVTIFVGSMVGYFTSTCLQENPLLHIGLLSFGSSALLYLVCEDLLIEAHKDGEMKVREVLHSIKLGMTLEESLKKISDAVEEEDRWYEDVWFFVGFLLSLLAG